MFISMSRLISSFSKNRNKKKLFSQLFFNYVSSSIPCFSHIFLFWSWLSQYWLKYYRFGSYPWEGCHFLNRRGGRMTGGRGEIEVSNLEERREEKTEVRIFIIIIIIKLLKIKYKINKLRNNFKNQKSDILS